MSDPSPTTLVGCLLDVSGSMRDALDSGNADGDTMERFRAILYTALQLARAEHRQNPQARMFIGVFGLKCNDNSPPSMDLCAVADEILSSYADHRTGHYRLVELANQRNLAHVSDYIRTKLTDYQARIVHMHLQRHPDRIDEFVDAIPRPRSLQTVRTGLQAGGLFGGAAAGTTIGAAIGLICGPVGSGIGSLVGGVVGNLGGAAAGNASADLVEDYAVENSDALQLARRICNEWLLDFADFEPRPVTDVVRLLQQLQEHQTASVNGGTNSLLDILYPYMFGETPMRDALHRSLAVFQNDTSSSTSQRTLLLASDGNSTDGDPQPIADDLKREQVTIATVYLTGDREIQTYHLSYEPNNDWNEGQRNLFNMASRISCYTHPIPVLASIGWSVPSSGECALYVQVCSAAVLNQFCEFLLSARFGSADALLDVVGRVRLDKYIQRKNRRICRKPSNQGEEGSCYAHAIAGVIHMALRRIYGREEGYPSIKDIRRRILLNFPWEPHGQPTKEVLEEAVTWYPPVLFKETDEQGARQAVLRRRPVLATFRLSRSGWDVFSQHFQTPATSRSVLTQDLMAPHRSLPDDGGHAVIMTRCDPQSLSFLNSWGKDWGDHGSFSIENRSVLELDDPSGGAKLCFYDVYWLEEDLTVAEKKAYGDYVDEMLRARAGQYPGILDLEVQCPLCHDSSPIANFSGRLRQAICPRCNQSFEPEPGHLAKALYARAGLSE